MSKKQKRQRTVIHCPLYMLSWMVQRGGSEQDAVDWYSKKMGLEKWKLQDATRKGHFTYGMNQRDSHIWFREDAGTGTIMHEVYHAIVRLADILDAPLGDDTDEIFAHYAGWLSSEIVSRLWH